MFQPTYSKVTLRTDRYSIERITGLVRFVGPMASTTNLVFLDPVQLPRQKTHALDEIPRSLLFRTHDLPSHNLPLQWLYMRTCLFLSCYYLQPRGIPYRLRILYVVARLTTYHCHPLHCNLSP